MDHQFNQTWSAIGYSSSQDWNEFLGLLHAFSMGTESHREFAEIRIYEVSTTDPSRVTFLLMHADRPVHTVVDQNNDERKFILNRRGQLLVDRQETAIAGKCDYSALGLQQLGGNRCR